MFLVGRILHLVYFTWFLILSFLGFSISLPKILIIFLKQLYDLTLVKGVEIMLDVFYIISINSGEREKKEIKSLFSSSLGMSHNE